jgi:hypothetical protein
MSSVVDPSWAEYFFRLALTEHRDVVEEFVEGDVLTPENAELLVLALNEKDKKEGKGKWNVDEQGTEWSVVGAVVVSNGPNSTSLPTKGTMHNVLILDFPDECQKPLGRVFLTYNN